MKSLPNLYRRKARIRATIQGTSERPRLSVSVSNRAISCQVIDDGTRTTLAASTSLKLGSSAPLTAQASLVGADIAKQAKAAKITKVVYDRNGRKYHGRVKALAEGARAAGLEF